MHIFGLREILLKRQNFILEKVISAIPFVYGLTVLSFIVPVQLNCLMICGKVSHKAAFPNFFIHNFSPIEFTHTGDQLFFNFFQRNRRIFQFVILKPLNYSFKETIRFDVKALFASHTASTQVI